MKRVDLQKLAVLRVKEAAHLLKAGCPDGAYYLAGYAVECAIKACIAKQTQRFEFPDKNRAMDSWTHDFQKLLRMAGLNKTLEAAQKSHVVLDANWKMVGQWSIESRYERHTYAEAKDLLGAVKDRKYGVLSWLKHRW